MSWNDNDYNATQYKVIVQLLTTKSGKCYIDVHSCSYIST